MKTCTPGRRPGVIRSFAYDVITLEMHPATANVVKARRYSTDKLFAAFRAKWETKYRHINGSFAASGGSREDRLERGWTIGPDVLFTDIAHLFLPDQ